MPRLVATVQIADLKKALAEQPSGGPSFDMKPYTELVQSAIDSGNAIEVGLDTGETPRMTRVRTNKAAKSMNIGLRWYPDKKDEEGNNILTFSTREAYGLPNEPEKRPPNENGKRRGRPPRNQPIDQVQ